MSYWKFESGIKNTAYWKRYWLGAAVTFVLLVVVGIAAEWWGAKGDVSGAMAEGAALLIFVSFIGAYFRRPKNDTGGENAEK